MFSVLFLKLSNAIPPNTYFEGWGAVDCLIFLADPHFGWIFSKVVEITVVLHSSILGQEWGITGTVMTKFMSY